MIKRSMLILLVSIIPSLSVYAQSLDQQIRRAQEAGQLTVEQAANILGNRKGFFNEAPKGISSLIVTPDTIEEVNMGYNTVYFPKGYGKNILHYGIWNAIPFVVFDNNSLELRFGLIFEHRQVGFVPDDWVSTSITGSGMPEISFLIPRSKTFLYFTQGSSQWRSTVLLTEAQISNLTVYAQNPNTDPNANIYTVNHRFIDSSARPYLIGLRHKAFFSIMLQLYTYIGNLPQVKKFKGTDAFPAGAFFEELSVQNVTSQQDVVQETITDLGATTEVDDGGGYDDGYGYDEGGYDGGYDDGYGYDE